MLIHVLWKFKILKKNSIKKRGNNKTSKIVDFRDGNFTDKNKTTPKYSAVPSISFRIKLNEPKNAVNKNKNALRRTVNNINSDFCFT